MAKHPISKLVEEHRQRAPIGLVSICSAHPYVIEAAINRAVIHDSYCLIESTSNQVNQYGGYTGMKPPDFASFVESIAENGGLPKERIILGGDHLGPNPWKNEAADLALTKGQQMVSDYVKAGYTKIHLDASMSLGGDLEKGLVPLPPEIVAERTAMLCKAAEDAYHASEHGDAGSTLPVYVIGSEVPAPGGTQEDEGIQITTAEDLRQTVELTKMAFQRFGVEAACDRIVAVVVQPGVEFGNQGIHDYDREAARELTEALRDLPGLVFEGHSTDYQLRSNLKRLVEDGVAILKVGPALTFAMREALFALDAIESELFCGRDEERSRLRDVLDEVMVAHPEHWENYYHGTENEMRLARKYSLSDRSRYYWTNPEVERTVERLIENLEREGIALNLLSQYMPAQHRRVREGFLVCQPLELVKDKIGMVLDEYYYAMGEDRW
ncbi:MAG: class II D-tagatose-bisphosphate aldolase, non-catalytic subunit [Firmicutes bacterium]|nr:class II D-tagatose-bisphosphate aldolase, non-catalytic subunit [Bacillota bacterium]